MSPINPVPVTPGDVKADPRKPYKAYLGAFVTFLGLLWASLEGKDNLGNMTVMEWAAVIIPVILTFAAVYGIENPKVVDPPPAGGPAYPVDERGAGEGRLILIIAGAIVLGLFLWWILTALLR